VQRQFNSGIMNRLRSFLHERYFLSYDRRPVGAEKGELAFLIFHVRGGGITDLRRCDCDLLFRQLHQETLGPRQQGRRKMNHSQRFGIS
jgi:hypothetical protein